jgi:hypothetical protein
LEQNAHRKLKKTPNKSHSERSEEPGFRGIQKESRSFVAEAPQDDSISMFRIRFLGMLRAVQIIGGGSGIPRDPELRGLEQMSF